MKKKPKLIEFDIDPLDYEVIIIGTPVWAWTITPPIRSFLSIFNLSGKNVALWTCSDGNGIKAMGRFKDALKDSNIVEEIRFQKPKENKPDKAKEKAKTWAKRVAETVK
jgi:flavodoxin